MSGQWWGADVSTTDDSVDAVPSVVGGCQGFEGVSERREADLPLMSSTDFGRTLLAAVAGVSVGLLVHLALAVIASLVVESASFETMRYLHLVASWAPPVAALMVWLSFAGVRTRCSRALMSTPFVAASVLSWVLTRPQSGWFSGSLLMFVLCFAAASAGAAALAALTLENAVRIVRFCLGFSSAWLLAPYLLEAISLHRLAISWVPSMSFGWFEIFPTVVLASMFTTTVIISVFTRHAAHRGVRSAATDRTVPDLVIPGTQQTNSFAIVALVLSLVGVSLPAVIFGHVAIAQIRRSAGRESGRGIAIAGLVIGYLAMAVWFALAIALFAFANSY